MKTFLQKEKKMALECGFMIEHLPWPCGFHPQHQKRKEENFLVKYPPRQYRKSSMGYCMGLCVSKGWQDTSSWSTMTNRSGVHLISLAPPEFMSREWLCFKHDLYLIAQFLGNISLVVSPKFTFISNQQHNPATTIQCKTKILGRTGCSQAVDTREQVALVWLSIHSGTGFLTVAIALPGHSLHYISSVCASTALRTVNTTAASKLSFTDHP